jgi:hypothetical protein
MITSDVVSKLEYILFCSAVKPENSWRSIRVMGAPADGVYPERRWRNNRTSTTTIRRATAAHAGEIFFRQSINCK